ncbi:putative reverse transcriptase domain-containing protein [Tanacetum coccineum]
MVTFFEDVCSWSQKAFALVEKKSKAKDKFYGKLILDLGNEVCSSVDQGMAAMERLVDKLDKFKEKVECKKLKKELEEAKLSNTFLRMQNERVERDLYWTRVRAHEFYQEMIRKGFVFEERPNEAIDVPIEDVKSSSPKEIVPPKSAPMTQAVMQRMIKESVDVAIGCWGLVLSGKQGEGAIELRRWFEKTESVLESVNVQRNVNQMPWSEMKQLMTAEFCPIEEIQHMENELWNLKVKEYDIVAYTQRLNELALMCPRMKYQKARLSRCELLFTAPTDGKLPLCERCFTRHVGMCTIKCHKCGKVGHKSRYCKEKNAATGANAQPIPTCYDCGEKGHTRNRCPEKVKQEEVGEVHARAYAIKDAEPKGPNVVTGTFLLNNRYASVLFDSGSDRSFMNTRFSSLLDIKPIKIEDSYEVELADGRIVSTNTVLKGCTLSLVNHIFEIDLMPIELGTFDVSIGMDAVKHGCVIIFVARKLLFNV